MDAQHHIIIYRNEATSQFDALREAAIESGLEVEDFDLGGEVGSGIDISNLSAMQAADITSGLQQAGLNPRNNASYD